MYLALRVDDNPFNHEAKQLFLVTSFQLIIQRSDARDHRQCCVQIVDMDFLILTQRCQCVIQSIPAILPVRPQRIPYVFRDTSRRMETSHARFFFMNCLQRGLQLRALIRQVRAEFLVQLLGVGTADEGQVRRIDLNMADRAGSLSINQTAQEARAARSGNAVVGRAAAGPPRIGGGACQPCEPATLLVEDQSGQQVILCTTDGAMGVAALQYRQPHLKIFRGNHRLPRAAHHLGEDVVALADDPACVHPVVEHVRERVDDRAAAAIRSDLDEGAARTVAIATRV
ncbi:MAG: hypothetical protein HC828_12580 [Blastochloris sp.]|nr:hypothetical protein [Blastochloris sp.]